MPRRSKSSWRIDPRTVIDFFAVNWALKLTALVLAFLLWSVVKAEEPDRWTIDEVPVRVDNRDGSWIMTAPPTPQTISITVTGPSRELLRLAFERPEILVPIEDVQDSIEVVPLRTLWVRIYGRSDNTRVDIVRPDAVTLRFERLQTKLVPLAVNLVGSPVPGFELSGPVQIDPTHVRVSGASSKVSALEQLRLPALDLSGRITTDTVTVPVDTTGLGLLVAPARVQVIVPIGRVGADSLVAANRRHNEQRTRLSGVTR